MIAAKVFVTMYMGTVNSSQETERRAKTLAGEVGSYHLGIKIDTVIEALVGLFHMVTGMKLPHMGWVYTIAEKYSLVSLR